MPWKASSVMEERLRFVARLLDGEPMTDLCQEFGISRKTGYKIFTRYQEHGCAALTDRSRRPVRYASQLPHQIEVYTPSTRLYRGLPDVTYPLHDRDIAVTACGRICLLRKKINISIVFAGHTLGIKEVDDGIWLVSFMDYDLGYIDLEQKTLHPLDNPFGPRVSPMSPVRPQPADPERHMSAFLA